MRTLILKNNFTWDIDKKLNDVKKFFGNLKIDFVIENTSYKDVPNQEVISAPNTFGNTIKFLQIQDKWYDTNISMPARARGFDCVVFLQEPKEFKGSPAQGYRMYNNLIIQEIVAQAKKKGSYNYCGAGLKGDQLTWILIHELLHAFYLKERKLDNTHKYFSAKTPEKCLEDFKTDYVCITRESDDGVQTLGTLTYKDFTCKTLEKPWKNNALNISCIPKGKYTCTFSWSMKFMKYTYRLQGTSPRSGILIHSASFHTDLQGCIALGSGYKQLNNDKELDLINSRITIKAFEELMNKKSFTLIIK